MLLGRMAGFLLLPVYTRYLKPADYGVLEIVDLTMFMLAAVIGVGIAGDALFYFHARLEDGIARRRAVQTVLLAAIGISATGAVLVQLFAPLLSAWFFRTDVYVPALRIAALAFLFGPPTDAFLCYIRAVEKTVAFMVFSLLRLVASIVLNVVLLAYFNLGLYAILVSNLVVSALICVTLAIYSMRLMSGWAGADWQILRKVVHYSSPIGIASISMLLVHYGDRFFLSRYCSLADIGIYALGYKLGMALSYLNSPFQMFWRSQVYTIIDDKNGDEIFVRVFCYLEILFVSAAFGLALFAIPLIRALSTSAFWGAAAYVPWLAGAYALSALEYQMQSALLVSAKTKKIMLSTLTGVTVCVITYAIAIPLYGVWGAVAATCLTFATMFSITFVVAQRQRHFHFPYLKIALYPATAAALVLARGLLPQFDPAISILISALFFLALPATLLAFPLYSEEKELIGRIAGKMASYVVR